MEEPNKTRKKRHFDNKIPCPSCGERIGFVESTCPFCDESIPFWSDKAGKIFCGLGFFLTLGYLVSIIYFWEDSDFLLFLTRGVLGIGLVFTTAERTARY